MADPAFIITGDFLSAEAYLPVDIPSDPARALVSRDGGLTIWKYHPIETDSPVLPRFSVALAKVFNAKGKGEWDANISHDRGQQRVMNDLGRGDIDITLLTMEDDRDVIRGFAYGYVIGADRIGAHEGPYHLDEPNRAVVVSLVKEELLSKVGSQSLFYFGPFGIAKGFRKGPAFLPFRRLAGAMLNEAKKKGAKIMLFYTSTDSTIYAISKLMGAEELYRVGENSSFVYLLQPMDLPSWLTLFPLRNNMSTKC